ncbi:hypothetical protein K1719_040398 [Acacia pycnantha]|nr:hypothetical protein K1719_040398 [Acacia pycnantha]
MSGPSGRLLRGGVSEGKEVEEHEEGSRKNKKVRIDENNFTGEKSRPAREEDWMQADERVVSPKSYRESLLQNVNSRVCWWEWSKCEEEEQIEDYGIETDFAKVLNPSDGITIDTSNPLCPKFGFEEKEKDRLLKPFGRTLIVKLLGRQPSYGFMMKKLRQLWARKGNIDAFDLQNDFYLVKFQHADDYIEALTGGPWVINDAYLNVARWRPEFSPKNERIESVVAWVRLPDLPAPLFDKKFLLNLGNVIGKAIKLDIHTAQRARGKFARMCIELDLTKPLVPEFEVEGQTLSIVYESLGMLCTKCGIYGHVKEGCEEVQRRKNEARMDVESHGYIRREAADSEGQRDRWQTVQRARRQRNFNVPTPNFQSGSRFTVLESETRNDEDNTDSEGIRAQRETFVGHGKVQGEGSAKVWRKQGKQGSTGEEKKVLRGSKVMNVDTGDKGERDVMENRTKKVGMQVKSGTERIPLREVKQVQDSSEYVPVSNMQVYQNKGVNSCEKENLHPGERVEEVTRNVEMELESEGFGKAAGSAQDCNGMVFEVDHVMPSLAKDLGAASKGIAAVIREMRKQYKIDIVAILEPRVSGSQANKIIRNWGFKHSRRVEAVGFSGGIWLLWEREDLLVSVIRREEQFLHCKVSFGGENMLFTAVYASPNEHRRHVLWEDLQGISEEIYDPWLIAGDFNEIKSPLEQKGGGRVNETRCRRFNNWIQDCNLLDLETSGPFFTWKGPKWAGLERVFKRLDRCLCNTYWQERFGTAEVRIVPRLGSDHHPIVVRLEEEKKGFQERPFRFQAAWLLHDSFPDIMRNNWSETLEAHQNLSSLQNTLTNWNKEVLSGKYCRSKNLLKEAASKNSDSEVWKNLVSLWPSVVDNMCWSVGNGEKVHFWTDRWLDKGKSLLEVCRDNYLMKKKI